MPIFAQVLHVVKPTAIFYGRVEPRRAHLLLVGLFCIFNVVFCQLVIGIGIHTSINLAAHLSIFYQFGFLNVLHIPSLGRFFLQFFLRKVHILDQTVASLISNVSECIMHLFRCLFISYHCAVADAYFCFLRSKALFFFASGFIIHVFLSILNIHIFLILASFVIFLMLYTSVFF